MTMSAYRLALATREHPSRLATATRGGFDIAGGIGGLTRRSWRSLYCARHAAAHGEPIVSVSGFESSIEGFIVDVAHILLLVGGLWMFVTAIISHG